MNLHVLRLTFRLTLISLSKNISHLLPYLDIPNPRFLFGHIDKSINKLSFRGELIISKNKNIDALIYQSDDWFGKFSPCFNILENVKERKNSIGRYKR